MSPLLLNPPAPSPTVFHDQIDALRDTVDGDVFGQSDDGYDAARAAWNLVVDQHPAVIVVADSTADIVAALRFARANNLRVAIQATGHGVARAADGALLIVTSRLDGVTIDPATRTAHVEAGATWGTVLELAQRHGLAPLLGSTTGVGAVGYTLGGGSGWLARRFGLASDSVIRFYVVTADGVATCASADEQPELFWALKGGGAGSLCVVVGMEIELYPVGTVYAGNLLYPVEMAGEVVARWRDWVAGVGNELTSSVVLMNFPPIDDVPEPLRGRSFVIVRGCWCGDLAEGKALIDGWRDWRRPAFDMFGPMPFSQADTISNDPLDPLPCMVTTEWADELADDLIELLLEAAVPLPGEPPSLLFAEVRHAGGAIRDRAEGVVNRAGRSGEFLIELVGVVMSPEAGMALGAHLAEVRRWMADYVTGATYLNFTEGREKQERSASAFDADAFARLATVKRSVDGDNLFSHGIAIA